MVNTRRAAAERAHAAAMAFSKLSGDEKGIILGKLPNTLEPRLVMYFSSASKELRALLPPSARLQLRTDYGEALALCVKVGMHSCKDLREATRIDWTNKGLTAADLATLAKLGSVLPALERLWLDEGRRWQQEGVWLDEVGTGSAVPTACSGWRRAWSRAHYRP